MRKLPILAIVLLAVSCSRQDPGNPSIGLLASPGGEGAAAAKAFSAAAAGKAEILPGEGENGAALEAEAITLLGQGPRVLAVGLGDGLLADKIIKKAKTKRVPTIFFGQEPSRKAMRSWDRLYFVGTRRENLGTAQGEILASYLKARSAAKVDKDGILQFAALTAAEDGEGSARQIGAVSDALAAAGIPNAMLAQEATAGADAKKQTAALLSVYGDRIEAIVAWDDETALGAAEAVKAAGYASGKRRIPVVGGSLSEEPGDIPDETAEAIRSGALIGTAGPDADAEGLAAFRLAMALAAGVPPGKAGLGITDAKYLWVPCRKIVKNE